jgi:hypothetical protein
MLGGRGSMEMFMMWAKQLLDRTIVIIGAVLGLRAEAEVVVVVVMVVGVVVMEEVGALDAWCSTINRYASTVVE